MDEAYTDFTLRLLRNGWPSGSTVLSPYSVFSALAMVYEGARSKTRREMTKVLGKEQSQRDLEDYIYKLGDDLLVSKRKEYDLKLANRLYVQHEMRLKAAFEYDIWKFHKGEIVRADFRTNRSSIVKSVNQWVTKTTHGKISNLISKQEISPETKMMLLNALYFKAIWSERFNKSDTKEMPFDVDPLKQITVPVMSLSAFFYFFEDSEVEVLELPYEGETVYMIILLPKNRFGLAEFERNLNGRKLLNYIKAPRVEMNIDVRFPKFKLEKEMDLSNTIRSMGMATAFNSSANFYGITKHQPLFINRIKHKTFIEVHEDGTEATTAPNESERESISKHKFVANHPFLFAICKLPAKIMFLGRYAGQEAAKTSTVSQTQEEPQFYDSFVHFRRWDS